MSYRQIPCRVCGGAFTVDVEQGEGRCTQCGSKYGPPWDDPAVLDSPVPESEWEGVDDEEPAAVETVAEASGDDDGDSDEATATTMQLGGGATIRITIEVIPGE